MVSIGYLSTVELQCSQGTHHSRKELLRAPEKRQSPAFISGNLHILIELERPVIVSFHV